MHPKLKTTSKIKINTKLKTKSKDKLKNYSDSRYKDNLKRPCQVKWDKIEQISVRVSMESQYQHLSPSLNWFRSQHPSNFPVTMSLGLNIQEIFQSQWVLVSTSKKFLSLDESRSQHPRNFPVSMSLSLNIQEISPSW